MCVWMGDFRDDGSITRCQPSASKCGEETSATCSESQSMSQLKISANASLSVLYMRTRR